MRQLVLHRPSRALVMPIQHLSATEIAAFIDSRLTPDARAAAELHLSGCPQCRDELASCLRLAGTAPSRSSTRVPWPLLGTIAAAVLVAVVFRPGQQRVARNVSRERATSPATSAPALAPLSDRTFARQAARFTWQRDSAAIGYHVVVTDSAGAPVWRSDDLSDTTVAPPSSVRLNPGARYFWRVDALHADGSSSQSATTGFRITP
jgi:anti-sigma factor RsiW